VQHDPVIRGPHDDPSIPDDELIRRRLEWFTAYTSQRNVFAPARDAPYTCPCCGHATLSERGGYEICSGCWWEDDGQDNHDSAVIRGGPNGRLSLDDARAEYIRKGGVPQPHLPPSEPI
jgi:Cysteine-rich CPCC